MEPEERPEPLLTPLFWAALVFAFLCVVAGVAVGVFGARMFPPHSASHTLGKSPLPR